MLKKTLLLLLLCSILSSYSQQLTINETINYINKTLENNSHPYSIELSENGYLTLIYYYNCVGCRTNIKGSFHWSEVTFRKRSYSYLALAVICDDYNKCIKESGHKRASKATKDYLIYSDDNYLLTKLKNAFNYLIYELKISEKYNRNDDDPFAPDNFDSNLYDISSNVNSDNIELENYSGVYKLSIKIGSLSKDFILDSGASDISISKKVEKELINLGIIKEEDYIEPALYRIADGSIIKCRRLIIPNLSIGKFKVYNVRASVSSSDSDLLLGRSFLDNFKKWSVDNNKNELYLEN